MKVMFKKLYPDSIIPTFAHNDPSNAGLDLYARFEPVAGDDAVITLLPGESVVIGTGVACEMGEPEYIKRVDSFTFMQVPMFGWKAAMIVKGRSGLALNDTIEASNAGVIDKGYRGEIRVLLRNHGTEPFEIKNTDRIAQGVVVLVPEVEVVEVAYLSPSKRGERGLGSSGR